MVLRILAGSIVTSCALTMNFLNSIHADTAEPKLLSGEPTPASTIYYREPSAQHPHVTPVLLSLGKHTDTKADFAAATLCDHNYTFANVLFLPLATYSKECRPLTDGDIAKLQDYFPERTAIAMQSAGTKAPAP